jgi:acyl-CoA dehydrogenase
MSFFQQGPTLGNQFDADRLLREYLERTLPSDVRAHIQPELQEMGELAAGELLQLSFSSRKDEPQLVSFDPWGRRIDEIRVPPAWKTFAKIACEKGLVAIPYEAKHGRYSRIHQFAAAYLFAPSSCIYTCPLAMSDGAARTLISHRNTALIERAVPRLISRDPQRAWTSGQWMTERIGGSDVGLSEAAARRDGASWRLFGTKWFTSATTSEMTLTLARPEGNSPGGKGLALFYLELRGPDGKLNGIRINRLKDKLGTRMLPTAEIELDGARAEPVSELSDGVKAISPMLQITRIWNALCSIASMRRALALANDYAHRRIAFGAPLAEKPLHLQTLADLQAHFEACFLLTFRAVELLGREEANEATETDRLLLRLIQPIVKLWTAKHAVWNASEALEAFGGAGYVEDTGLPALLRDAQVLPIWEGTTNVLALDMLRALGQPGTLEALMGELSARANATTHADLQSGRKHVITTAERIADRLRRPRPDDPHSLEASARGLAMGLGRAWGLALLLEHAQTLLDRGQSRRSALAARQLSAHDPNFPSDVLATDDARSLAFG